MFIIIATGMVQLGRDKTENFIRNLPVSVANPALYGYFSLPKIVYNTGQQLIDFSLFKNEINAKLLGYLNSPSKSNLLDNIPVAMTEQQKIKVAMKVLREIPQGAPLNPILLYILYH